MKIGRLKELLNALPSKIDGVSINEVELFTRNSFNPVGDINELEQLEIDSYCVFGKSYPCILLNTSADIDRKGNRIDLDLGDSEEESDITIDFKEKTEEYERNLAVQKKLAATLKEHPAYHDLGDAYAERLIPGVLTEIDNAVLMTLLPELLGRAISREEFLQNRDQFISALMNPPEAEGQHTAGK